MSVTEVSNQENRPVVRTAQCDRSWGRDGDGQGVMRDSLLSLILKDIKLLYTMFEHFGSYKKDK